MICASRDYKNKQIFCFFALMCIIALNLPELKKHFERGVYNREMIFEIDNDLLTGLRKYTKPNDIVAFVSLTNDIMANYLVPRLGVRSYNIGEDKNLRAALPSWPAVMQSADWEINQNKVTSALNMLLDGTADAIVIPYFHMYYSAFVWPCIENTTAELSGREIKQYRLMPHFICPENAG